MRASLRNKLTASHLAVIFITALLIGVGSYLLLVDAHHRQTISFLQMVSKNISQHLDSVLTEKENDLREIAESREVEEYHTAYRYDEMMDYFSHFRKDFSSLAYLNVDGEEEVAMENGAPPEQLENFSRRCALQTGDGQSRPGCYRPGKQVRQRLGRNCHCPDRPLQQRDKLRTVRHRPPGSLRDRTCAFLDPGENYIFVQDHEGKAVFGIFAPGFLRNQGDPLAGSGYASENRLGVDGYYAAMRMTKLPWTVVSIVPSTVYSRYPDILRSRAFLAFLATCLLGTLIARWVSGRLTEPLFSLTKTARRIAAGESTDCLPVPSDDEIGTLVQAFNRMAESLQRTTLSRDYVENIFQSLKECLLVVDSNGTISYANKTAFTLLQYGRKRAARPPSLLYPGETWSQCGAFQWRKRNRGRRDQPDDKIR